jgi:capsular polysaccharide biosynthesis protein
VTRVTQVTVRAPQALAFGHVAAGAFTAEGKALPLPPLFTSTDSIFPHALRPKAMPRLRLGGLHLWGGVGFDIFGHWLTETFPLLVTLRPLFERHPEAPILMVTRPGAPPPVWGALHRTFAGWIGLDLNRIRVIEEDAVVEELALGPDPFGRRNHYRPETLTALDALGLAPPDDTGAALFLSRRKLSERNNRTPNIEAVEERFRDLGYEILHPETLTLPEQMRRLLGARHLAGENGSALHWSLYSPHVASVLCLGWNLKLQEGICKARGQSYVSVRSWGGRLRGRKQVVPLAAIDRAMVQIGK